MYIRLLVYTGYFRKAPFSKCFPCTRTDEETAFSTFSGLKNVFEKLRFHDGLVWTVSLTVEIKLRFIIPAV